jgi:predicted nuclease of predicted toxin-antitoxin system
MKILIDMNISPDWVKVFEKYEIEAVHWSNVGDPREKDEVIMEWARANGYIIFTHDLDFGSLLAATQDILPISIENLVIAALRQFEEQLNNGALVTVEKAQSRVRILPIKRG